MRFIPLADITAQTLVIMPRYSDQILRLGSTEVVTVAETPARIYGTGTIEISEGYWDDCTVVPGVYAGDPFHGSSPTIGVGLTIPATVPFILGSGTGVSEYMVTVDGDVATWPVFELHGPILDPFIDVVGVGRLIFKGQLAYDQTLTVDTRPWARWVKRNGSAFPGALSPSGARLSDMALAPGSYQVFFGGYDPTGTSTLDVRAQPAYTSF